MIELCPRDKGLQLRRILHLCVCFDLCRLGQQHPLCDSIEFIQDVDECWLQEGLCLITVLRLALAVPVLLLIVLVA